MAMNSRYASAPRMGGPVAAEAGPYASNRSLTPHRLIHSGPDAFASQSGDARDASTPTSSGLIRLTLKKPMGIVFEPMYDPNAPSVQRGVRICDLPRTGAAALSRKLEIGDELLQINDTTVSRLSFDEIMDFIIEADPDAVNLLFRRPRRETLQARNHVQQKLNAVKDNPPTIKWKDEDIIDKKEKKKKRSKRTKSVSEEEETLQSSVADSSYQGKSRRRKKRGPYESESFLDLLIDTICSNSNPCRDTLNMDEFSDDESFDTNADESTYVTYEESEAPRPRKGRKAREDENQDSRDQRRKPKHKDESKRKKYEDDATLETMTSNDRIPTVPEEPVMPLPTQPLGLAEKPKPAPAPVEPEPVMDEATDIGNPAPIKEVQYDEFDQGADVSVMESLGGPSLLIEKQRAAYVAQQPPRRDIKVPKDVIDQFGLDFPAAYGMTREQTIQHDPLRFYNHVVKAMLQEHEPEKVRLLSKLMAKYEGREDHLVQKLAVRYERKSDSNDNDYVEDGDELAFTDAVRKSKASSSAEEAVNTAKERMGHVHDEDLEQRDESPQHAWPEKEEKEPDSANEDSHSIDESEYSGDEVDGTSPAVIAQVSELLNYVYGKTSVPGQIDRVSTIMRAYEGREAVLLELLETKALIKANKEKENAEDLPEFLRNSTSLAQRNAKELGNLDLPAVTPMAGGGDGTINDDDISSMSGVSSPAAGIETMHISSPSAKSAKQDVEPMSEVSEPLMSPQMKSSSSDKKKKGIFGGLFGRKKGKDATTPSRGRGRRQQHV